MVKKMRDLVKDKFDVRVIITVIYMTMVEFELFNFAQTVVNIAGNAAWISIILGTIFVSINTYILSKLALRFPDENFFEYCQRIWGKTLTRIIAVGYFLYWFSFISLLLESFSKANQTLFLHETPLIVPLILLILGAIWLVAYGMAPIIRFFQLMLLFVILPLLLLIILSIREIRWDSYLPILGNGIIPILKGALFYGGVFQGLEIILFITPFLNGRKKLIKMSLIGVNITSLMSLILATISIGILGVQGIKESIWPGMDTVGIIQLPGFLIERYELFLTMPWLIGIFTTICIFLYLLAYGIVQVFGCQFRKGIIFAVGVLAVAATYFCPNLAWLMKMRIGITYVTFVFGLFIPLLTLLVAVVKKQKGSEVNE